MFLRSLLTSTSPLCFAPDDGGSAPAPALAPAPSAADSLPRDSGSAPAAPPQDDDEPKLSLDEQLSKVWDDAHSPTARDERGRFRSKNPDAADPLPKGERALKADEADEADGGDEDNPEFADDGDGGDDRRAADGEDDRPAGDDDDGAETPTVAMPRSWSKDKAEVWKSLSPEAREYITQRETDVTQALSRAGRAVHAMQQHQPVLNAVEPYREYLGQVGHHLGIHPAQLINDVLRFEHTLRTAPSNDAKLEVLKDIVATYGVDVSPLIGADAAQSLQARNDPRVDVLARQVQQLTNERMADRRAQAEAVEREFRSHVQAAEADTKNFPYFAQVRPLMKAILETQDDDGTRSAPQLLKDAYEQACRAHPDIWKRIHRDQRRQTEDELRQKTGSKTEAARRASAINVRSGVPSPSKRTLNDDLEAVADRHYGRRN